MNNFINVDVKRFGVRCRWLFIWLTVLQLFYISFIVILDFKNILTLGVIFCIGMLCFWLIMLNIKNSSDWPLFNVRVFSGLFFISAFFVLFFSRLEYIQSYLLNGLYETRADESLGRGGWYSMFTVLFYPLCIILAFINISRFQYYLYSVLMFLVMFIDAVYLGTRGAPIFVLLFHILMARWKFNTLSFLVAALIGLMALVFIFDSQTQARSLDSVSVGWDWVNTLTNSWLMDNMSVREDVLVGVGRGYGFLYPLIFLMQYLSHSIAELRMLLEFDIFEVFGRFVYLHDQYCLVFRCDRAATEAAILAANPRAGLYQTLYASLVLDFGLFGLFFMGAVFFLSLTIFRQFFSRTGASVPYLLVILSVSGVENYLYNGLGLARFIVFLILFHLLVKKNSPV